MPKVKALGVSVLPSVGWSVQIDWAAKCVNWWAIVYSSELQLTIAVKEKNCITIARENDLENLVHQGSHGIHLDAQLRSLVTRVTQSLIRRMLLSVSCYELLL